MDGAFTKLESPAGRSALPLCFARRREVKRFVDGAYSGRTRLFMSEVNVAEFLHNCAKVLG